MTLGQKIAKEVIKIAQSYVGKEEISGNLGFKDKELEAEMSAIGWQKGHAWCAYFSELVWKEAFSNFDEVNEQSMRLFFRKVFSGSSLWTLDNFKKSGWEIEDEPSLGALAIWKRTNGGHIDIVTKIRKKDFEVVGGNLSDKVSTITRTIPDSHNMVIQGFVPVESKEWKRFMTSK